MVIPKKTNFINFFPFLVLFNLTLFAQVNDSIVLNNTSSSNKITLKDSLLLDNIQQYTNVDPNYIYQYSKPKFWDKFKYIPGDLAHFGNFVIQKENLKWDAIVLGSTAAIIPFDQEILDESGRIGERIGGWDKDGQYEKVGGLLRIVPKNISSAVYYLGNGGTTLLLSGMFYGISQIREHDLRALNTSSELIECLMSVGVVTQTIKRITGRQSPSAALASGNPGGDWNWFPSFSAFQSNTPNYDAMPSGHIATYMATLTIISTNYPEIKWIKPVGYSMMGLLAFNMVSSKVHWTSDYPIGIFIGYVIGKKIANRRIEKIEKKSVGFQKEKKYDLDYSLRTVNNTTLFGAKITF